MNLNLTLQNSAVLQRNKKNVSAHIFSGSCRATGKVYLTARANGDILEGFDNVECGFAARGQLQGAIAGLPVGGPYSLSFCIGNGTESASYNDIYVGDLWLLAGQSNMADSGFMPSMVQPHPEVHAFYMDNHWGVAKDPLHDVMHAAAPVHGGNPNNPRIKPLRGTGPGLPFGLAMYEATKVPQGLIPCAHGGTSMSQWDPKLKKMGGNSLYGALYERLKNLGGQVAGVLWYQGCNETGSRERSLEYASVTRKLFAALRRDCKNRDLPIVFAQLGPYAPQFDDPPEKAANWLLVQQAQYQIGRTLKNSVCVPTIDLELDDHIHLSNRAVVILGKRMAQAMQSLLKLTNNLHAISVAGARCTRDKNTNSAIIEVRFNNVQGQLSATGLPSGFSVVDKEGKWVSNAVNVRLVRNRAIVQTRASYMQFSDRFRIAYGGILQPHANITDAAGRSLPCFMLDIKNDHPNISRILSQALVSNAVCCDDSFAALQLPENFENLEYQPAKFNSFYLQIPPAPAGENTRGRVHCYKFKVKAIENMQTQILMGADAPFLVYCDNQQIMHQWAGNPIVPDEFSSPVTLSAGEHDFVVVLSANCGHGYGFCCRFERTDGAQPPEIIDL